MSMSISTVHARTKRSPRGRTVRHCPCKFPSKMALVKCPQHNPPQLHHLPPPHHPHPHLPPILIPILILILIIIIITITILILTTITITTIIFIAIVIINITIITNIINNINIITCIIKQILTPPKLLGVSCRDDVVLIPYASRYLKYLLFDALNIYCDAYIFFEPHAIPWWFKAWEREHWPSRDDAPMPRWSQGFPYILKSTSSDGSGWLTKLVNPIIHPKWAQMGLANTNPQMVKCLNELGIGHLLLNLPLYWLTVMSSSIVIWLDLNLFLAESKQFHIGNSPLILGKFVLLESSNCFLRTLFLVLAKSNRWIHLDSSIGVHWMWVKSHDSGLTTLILHLLRRVSTWVLVFTNLIASTTSSLC